MQTPKIRYFQIHMILGPNLNHWINELLHKCVEWRILRLSNQRYISGGNHLSKFVFPRDSSLNLARRNYSMQCDAWWPKRESLSELKFCQTVNLRTEEVRTVTAQGAFYSVHYWERSYLIDNQWKLFCPVYQCVDIEFSFWYHYYYYLYCCCWFSSLRPVTSSLFFTCVTMSCYSGNSCESFWFSHFQKRWKSVKLGKRTGDYTSHNLYLRCCFCFVCRYFKAQFTQIR